MLLVEVKANEHQHRQAGEQLCDAGVAKVTTLIGPNAEEKAYIRLAPHRDDLHVACKIGII